MAAHPLHSGHANPRQREIVQHSWMEITPSTLLLFAHLLYIVAWLPPLSAICSDGMVPTHMLDDI